MSPRFPVSIKAVVLLDGRVPLLYNARDEWELPGGRLEAGEQPEETVVRELEEELGLAVRVAGIVDSWLYAIPGHGEVVIVTYGCRPLAAGPASLRLSAEHRRLELFDPAALDALPLPEGYRRSIRRWLREVSR